jgi:periplasmic protein TonB
VSGIKFPLTLSIAGHAICLSLLVAFMSHQAPPIPEPIAKGGIEVLFQSPPPPETPPPPAETPPPEPQAEVVPPPEPQAEVVPPPQEPPPVATEPTPPAPEAPVAAIEPAPPPPLRKPAAKKPPKPPVQHVQPVQPPMPASPSPTPPSPSAPPQTASAATPAPAPVPAPEASAGYRALLSAWLESHKRYPDPARQRGEEGNAVLRFEVDRSGHVIYYAITRSSGYPDLDASVEEMMRGATLPPFPAGMPQPRMQVSVTIRFSLRR